MGKRGFKGRGRVAGEFALAEARELLAGLTPGRESLIDCLHRINDRCGGIHKEQLVALAALARLSMAEVYETATFYHRFHVYDRAEDIPQLPVVHVCDSVSCCLNGAEELRAGLESRLKGRAVVRPVACLGRCAGAPAVLAGRKAMEHVTPERVVELVEAGDLEADLPDYVDYEAYCEGGGYSVYRDCLEDRRRRDEVIEAIEAADLRGLGGAGFPAARKWRLVAAEPGPRHLAVNIDESEPGTFKDRFYLESDPHRMLEGALIAAWAVGLDSVYIYLRDEYHGCRLMLEAELGKLRSKLGGHMPPVHLRRGAGAYICGEESAMIESIEGKKGMPRLRPPYIAQTGLFGRPTLEHNMETLHWIRDIIEGGPSAHAKGGMNGRKGMRSFSVSGRVNLPGVHRVPAGITLRELVDDYCGGMLDGHKLYGYLPGGASGGMLPASMADIPLDFDTLQERDPDCFIGSAAVIVFSDKDSAREIARGVMRFFEDESCGKCTPCRVGTAKAVQLMEKDSWNLALLTELSRTMADASICGLGQAAPNVTKCLLRHFPDEVR